MPLNVDHPVDRTPLARTLIGMSGRSCVNNLTGYNI